MKRKQPPKPRGLGKRIQAARKTLGLTQAELARRCRVDHSTVFRWEVDGKGGSVPDSKRLAQLTQILGVSYDHLLTGAPHVVPEQSAEGAAS